MNTKDALSIEIKPGQGVMAVMNEEGDKKTIWNRDNPVEVEAARQEFAFFKAKGYMAYKVEGKEGTRGEVIGEFDPGAQRIIFAPPMRGGSHA